MILSSTIPVPFLFEIAQCTAHSVAIHCNFHVLVPGQALRLTWAGMSREAEMGPR